MNYPKQKINDSGLAFTPLLAKQYDDLILRRKRNKPAGVVVDGIPGTGKTTHIVHAINYFNKAFNKPVTTIGGVQFSAGAKEFTKKIEDCYDAGLPTMMYDEAGDFSSGRTQSRLNHELNTLFQRARQYNIIILMALPTTLYLDKRAWSGIPRFLVHLDARIDHENKKDDYVKGSVYDAKKVSKLYKYYKDSKETFPWEIYRKEIPNFHIITYDLPKKQAKELELWSMTAKRRLSAETRGLITYNDVEEQLKKSRIWIYKKVKELAIMPEKTVKKIKYFKPEIINQLAEVTN